MAKNVPASSTDVLPELKTADDRDFVRIASVSTALGLAFMAGAIQALRDNQAGFYFAISLWTWVAAIVGGAIGMGCWKLMRQGGTAAKAATVFLILIGVSCFLYPLRFVSHERLPDIAKGLAVAATSITVGGTLIWQLKRGLESDNSAT